MAEESSETITLTAINGEPIVLRKWKPKPKKARNIAVLIPPAMATPSRFYTSFVLWLVAQGYQTYSFDYQGYADSATGPLKSVKADLLTWADDSKTVASFVKKDAAGMTFVWLAHSLGAQLLAFAKDDEGKMLPDRAILVAGGTGYWRLAEGKTRIVAPILWYFLTPLITRTLGYYPGQKLRILGDLPPKVMQQWAGWCRNKDYLWGVLPEHVKTFASVNIPVTSITFTDDETMSAKASKHLEDHYSGAELKAIRYEPKELGVERVGHMGFFKSKNENIWANVLIDHIENRQ